MSIASSKDVLEALEKLENLRDPQHLPRRAFQRFLVRGDAHLLPMDRPHVRNNPSPEAIEIKLRDISRGGLGFVTTQKIEPGSTWRIVFYHEGFAIGEQAGVIRYSREIQPELYLSGAAFIISNGILSMLGVDLTHIDDADDTDFNIPSDFTDHNN
ncbi:MAG: PilZ domain-containing protein [Phycisphaeraceae bacterium]